MSSSSESSGKTHVVQTSEKDDSESFRDAVPIQAPQSPIQAIRTHPREFLWCLYAIYVLVLSSFDNQAGSVILGIPEFRKTFGRYYEGNYVLPAHWQSAYSGAPVLSSIIGSIGAGWLADRIGRKWTLAIGYIFVFVAVTIETIATTNAVFFAGKFIAGFAIGSFSATAITYIGEIAPLPLRGILTAATGMAFSLGPFVVSLIVKGAGTQNNAWAYRSVFMSQYAVALIGAMILPFMPESPIWLMSRGRKNDAVVSLSRFGYPTEQLQRRVYDIAIALQQSERETKGATYMECFRNTNLRRTVVAAAPLSIQALSGVFFVSAYSTYYQQLAGYNTGTTFSLGIIQQILSMLGNACSWFLIERVGRRPLIFYGMIFVTALLLLTGGLAVLGTVSAIHGTVALLLLYNWAYNLSIGATGYPILIETPTSRLRVKTASIAFSLQSALFAMWAFVIPYLFNPDQANLRARVAFIFGGFAILSIIYLWFCQPETSGRSFEEIDEMFLNRVPARKFKTWRPEHRQGVELRNFDTGSTRVAEARGLGTVLDSSRVV